MLAKTITYTDFNDTERTETFYFNLTKTELAQLEYSHGGGLTEWIKRAAEAQNGKIILEVFEEIIKATYGEKSPDGRNFLKSDEIFNNFKGTNAYDQLYMELVTDGDKAAAFLIECMPKELREEARKNQEKLAKDNTKTIKKVES
ncbi:MAG: hypothetical protein J6U54_05660 [Clostridiales bacterium]|nr:hypothetical protein [Clostridiales bacterium]